MKRSPDIVQARDPSGWTLLHVAVMNESMYFVHYIVTRNPSAVNVRGKGFQSCLPYVNNVFRRALCINGATVLHIACLCGNVNLIEYLLSAGADWMIKDCAGRIPEQYIVEGSDGINNTQAFWRMCEGKELKRSPDSNDIGWKTIENDAIPDMSNVQVELEQAAYVEETNQNPSRGTRSS